MKTIKFRGKSILTDKWFYGDLVHSADKKRTAILVNDKDSYDECEVVPETLGQFTGLYDKNGKEIYEGDILHWDANNRLYVVIFESGMFYASVKECNEGIFGGFPLHRLTEYEDEKCEIVGNIYDNQELLKKLNTMTEKEKAKAYDEALEKASAAHKDEDRHLKATLERIFPELKERY